MLSFDNFLVDTQRIECDTYSFLFRDFQDIIIHRSSAVVGSGAHAHDDEHAATENLGAIISSSDEDSIVENSYQRNPLKGYRHNALPEKVGKLFAVLHFLLVAKILRIYRVKNIHRRFEVKGILDRFTATVQCFLLTRST